MVDVANATAAAPQYFPAARVGALRLIDGGVWANNPSVLAIAEATSMLGASIHRVRVLNVGTMKGDASHGKKLDTAGLLGWARPAAPTILNASSRGGQGIAEHLVGRNNYYYALKRHPVYGQMPITRKCRCVRVSYANDKDVASR